jgi:hypothetical protein
MFPARNELNFIYYEYLEEILSVLSFHFSYRAVYII